MKANAIALFFLLSLLPFGLEAVEYFTVLEEQEAGTFVGNITRRENFKYYFRGEVDFFQVNADYGSIFTKTKIDRESLQNVELRYVVVSSTPVYATEVSIRVLDINDNSPKFKAPFVNLTILESTEIGSLIPLESAFDPDFGNNSALSYTIVSGNDDDKFEIEVILNLLHLKIKQKLDREYKYSYYLNISSFDNGTPRRVGYVGINITVGDINDNTPLFNPTTFRAEIYENATIGSSLIQLVATDQDIGLNGQITYSLQDSKVFDINKRSGLIFLKSQLDYEKTTSYTLKVIASDGGTPSSTATATVSVLVKDVNDNSPVISSNKRDNLTLDENVDHPLFVFFSISDLDFTPVSLNIVSGNTKNKFRIISFQQKNVFLSTNELLDREDQEVYSLLLRATDSGNPPLSTDHHLIINVGDKNDNHPVFERQIYRSNIKEGCPRGTYVKDIKATDSDAALNSFIRYFITDGNYRDWFHISVLTGLITTNTDNIDFDVLSKPYILLTVTAKDMGSPPLYGNTTVNVSIESLNDNTPTFNQSLIVVKLNESLPINAIVMKLQANDIDLGDDGAILFDFYYPSALIKEYFQINMETGEIVLMKALEFSEANFFQFYVIAKDKGSPSRYSKAHVYIEVIDTDNHGPNFALQQFHVNVLASRSLGRIESFVATDLDSDVFGKITYSIETTSCCGFFVIDSITGELNSTKVLTAGSEYLLYVKATSNGKTAKSSININVLGSFQQSIFFERDDYFFTVDEDVLGKYVGKVIISQAKSLQIYYSIINGDVSGCFEINSKGEILTKRAINREKLSKFQLTVAAWTNQSNFQTVKTKVTIWINDMNDNAPIIIKQALQDYTVHERSRVGHEIFKIEATDLDSRKNGVLRYTLLEPSSDEHFQVNQFTGVVYLIKSLMYKRNKNQYSINVLITDMGMPRQSLVANFPIKVIDTNNHGPVFSALNFSVIIPRNISVNSRFLQVKAIDFDFGSNGNIVYKISSGNVGDTFGIFPSGWIYLKAFSLSSTIDFYVLNVSAFDQGKPEKGTSTQVSIFVQRLADASKIFRVPILYANVMENNSPNLVVANISDNIISKSRAISFKFGMPLPMLSIDGQTGVVKTEQSLDREGIVSKYGGANITGIIIAEISNVDREIVSESCILVIAIRDANDNGPIFEKKVYRTSVSETAAPGAFLLRVHAIDKDSMENSLISYEIYPPNPMFSIDSSSGVVSLASKASSQKPDYEERHVYNFSVLAKDSKNVSMSSSCQIFIHVSDSNDNRPNFDNAVTTLQISEQTAVGTTLFVYNATDKDSGANGLVEYSLSSSTDTGTFAINKYNGQLYLIKELDYESKVRHVLEIIAKDNGSPSLQTSLTVTVQVSDYNDNYPIFNKDPETIKVVENTALHSVIGRCFASDLDSGLNKVIRFSSVQQSPVNNAFKVDPDNCEISTLARLDRELHESYYLIIKAENNASTSNGSLAATKNITVMIDDVNDNIPMFIPPMGAGFSRTTSTGWQALKVTAEDPDKNSNGTVKYSIKQKLDHACFSIDQSSGSITVTAPLSVSKKIFEIEVEAKDEGVESRTSVAVIRFFVFGSKSNAPRCSNGQTNLHENVNIGTNVFRISAISTETNSEMIYVMKSGNLNNAFFVNSTTGWISTRKMIDFETGPKRFNLFVYAVEKSGSTPMTAECQVQIDIKDVNDNAPLLINKHTEVSVYENASVGSEIFQFRTEDKDSEPNAIVYYSIISGNDLLTFAIDRSSGKLTLAKKLDHKTVAIYKLMIEVSNAGTQRSTKQFIVNVVDVNDHAPVFQRVYYSFTIQENSPRDTFIGKVQASDSDSGRNGQIFYEILNGNGKNFFIDHESGKIWLIGSVDYERVPNFILDIKATDYGSPRLSNTVRAFVNIADVNDNCPIFSKTDYLATVNENLPKDALVVQVLATDKDFGTNSIVKYEIVDGNEGNSFVIDNEGTIRTRISLDREQKDVFSLLLRAFNSLTDERRCFSYSKVTVKILDVNDNIPILSQPHKINIYESSMPGEQVHIFTGIDKDTGVNSSLLFSISGPTEVTETFSLKENGGLILISKLDFETRKVFSFKLQLSDKGTPALMSETTVQINVIDVNDNNPVIMPHPSSVSLLENVTIGTTVIELSSFDLDSGENARVSYRILTGNRNNTFSIETESGILYTEKELDREMISDYSLEIEVKDHGVPFRRGITTLHIHVIDVNDIAPSFSPSSYNVSVIENVLNENLLTLTARDNDAGSNMQIQYSLDHSPISDLFSINPQTGRLSLSKSIDREAVEMAKLVVTARDRGAPSLSGKVTVFVNVLDENDNSPSIKPENATVRVNENLNSKFVVQRLQITDPDFSENGTVDVSLANDFASFEIKRVADEYVVYTTRGLDREIKDYYLLEIEAIDRGSPKRKTVGRLHVFVDDNNDNPPVFTKPRYEVRIPSDAPTGTFVTQLKATDRDLVSNSNMQYIIVSGSTYVNVESGTGIITTRASIPGKTTLEAQAEVSDPLNVAFKDRAIIAIATASGYPRFSHSSLYDSLSENVAIGARITKVNATSDDLGPGGKIRYFITSGNEGLVFKINQTSGELFVNAKLDYESKNIYSLWLEARDSKNPPLSAFVKFVITVKNENDSSPIITSPKTAVLFTENQGSNALVTRVIATDRDNPSLASRLRYRLGANAAGLPFVVDQINGEVRSTKVLDRESIERYSLEVVVYPVGQSWLSTAANLTIVIQDMNDNQPVIHSPSQLSVSENLAVNSEVITLNVTDDDAGANGQVTFYLISSFFSIGRDTGRLTLIKSLDREAQSVHTLSISVRDPNYQKIFTLTVVVTDVNDSPPRFSPTTSYTDVLESVPIGQIFGKVTAEDSDTGTNAQSFYHIEPRSGYGFVVIDPFTGSLRLKKRVKYTKISSTQGNSKNLFRFTIKARNIYSPYFTATGMLYIRIVDANDHAPVFSNSSYHAFVESTANIGHVVSDFSVEDRMDAGLNAEVQSSIVSGNGSSLFSLHGNKLRVRATLSPYVNRVLTVLIEAKDRGAPIQKSTASFYVTVTAENRYSPVFSKKSHGVRVPENKQLYKELVRFSAIDQDSGDNGAVKYIIVSGNVNMKFAVGRHNGSLYLVGLLDYEQNSEYNLVIKAEDSSKVRPRMATATVRMIVTDVNDNAPVFSAVKYEAKITENVPANTHVTKVHATDKDSSVGNSIKYEISDPIGRLFFTIDASSGIIRTRTGIDYERNPFFNIKVVAKDNGSPMLSSSVNINITVIGINEYNPKFVRNTFNFSVSQFAAINSTVGTLSAIDNDHGIDGVSVYLQRFSYQEQFFSLETSTGRIKVNKRLVVGKYTVKVFVKNLVQTVLTPENIDEATISIEVSVGNAPPAFVAAPYFSNVVENSATGKSVLSIRATDDGGTVSYKIMNQSPFDAFAIDSSSGLVTVNAAIDREQVAKFSFTVMATDNATPPASNATIVVITVTDANDNKPRVINCIGSVKENATSGSLVTNLTVLDRDIEPNKGPFAFNLQGTPPFAVNSKGELVVAGSLDRETISAYNLTIDVTDNGSPAQTSRNFCIITVIDVSDVKPISRNVSVIINTLGGYPSGGLVGDLSPIDPDTADSYACSLNNEANLFHFEKSSCRLQIASHRISKPRRVSFLAVTKDSQISDAAYIEHIFIINATRNNTVVLRMHRITHTVKEFTNSTILRLSRVLESFSPAASLIRVIGFKRQAPATIDLLVAQQDKVTSNVQPIGSLTTLLSSNVGKIQQVTGASNIDIPYAACKTPGLCLNNGSCYEERKIENYPTILDSASLIFHSVSFKATFACSCQPGFYGRRCEKIISSCSPNPCRNGGVCSEKSSSGAVVRQCTCIAGFTGKFCESDVNECLGSPCKNSGICLNTKGGYNCQCGPRYTGKTCESTVDFCNPNPCLFGGKCVTSGASFSCICNFGNKGKFCEINPMTFPALSYLSTKQAANPHQALNITLEFATYDKKSLLVYGFHRTLVGKLSPFVGLELIDGRLQFSYGFGGASNVRRFSLETAMASDGTWHTVSVYLTSQKLTLKVDNSMKQDSLSETNQSPNLDGAPLYIGGIPSIQSILQRPSQVVTEDYTGCMRNVYVNGYHVDQSTALKSYNVAAGCTKSAGCTGSPCKDGECVDNWDGYQCQCKSGYAGDSCNEAAKPFTFGGSSFVMFELKESYRRKMQMQLASSSTRKRRAIGYKSSDYNSLSIEFRTRDKNGLLMHSVDIGGNFTILHIDSGEIRYEYQIKNQGNGVMVINKPLVTDGKWHNISLNVSDQSVSLSLDNNQIVQNAFTIAPHQFYSIYTDVISIAGTSKPFYLNGKVVPKFTGCLNRVALNDDNLAVSSSAKFNVTRVGPVTNHCTGRNVCNSNPCTDPVYSYCIDEWEAFKCVDPGQCKTSPCKHNGICIPTQTGYTCNCRSNFTGRDCETPIICLTSPCRSEESCVAHDTKVFECVSKPQTSPKNKLGSSEIAMIVVFTLLAIVLIIVIIVFVKRRQPLKRKEFDGDFNSTGSGIEMKHTTRSNLDNRGFEPEPYLQVVKGSQEQISDSKMFLNKTYVDESSTNELNLISRRNAQFISTSQPAFKQPRSQKEAENTKASNRSLPDDLWLEKQRNERILQDLHGLSSMQYRGSSVPQINDPQINELHSLRRSNERMKESTGSLKLGTTTPPFESGFESTGSDMDSEREHDIMDGSSQLELYDLEVASIKFSEMSWEDNNSSCSRDVRRDYIDKRLDRLRSLVPQFGKYYEHGSTVSDRNARSDRLSDRLSDLMERDDSSSDSDGSFTGSEYEYGDGKISTNKLKRKRLVFSKHPQTSDSDAESSFMPRRRNSMDSSITSMTDVGSIRHPPASEPRDTNDSAIPSIDWDELLNWAMKYENLTDVYREIAALNESETDDEIVLKPVRISSARSSARHPRDSDLLQKPIKFYSAQELHSEEYV